VKEFDFKVCDEEKPYFVGEFVNKFIVHTLPDPKPS